MLSLIAVLSGGVGHDVDELSLNQIQWALKVEIPSKSLSHLMNNDMIPTGNLCRQSLLEYLALPSQTCLHNPLWQNFRDKDRKEVREVG